MTRIFFREQLLDPANAGPRRYLEDRGFGELLADTRWTVGFAPDSWTSTRDHLAHLGYSDDVMRAAGITTLTRRGTDIDRFRSRITFGIRDADGALVGFSARSAPGAGPRAPKYLNTATTQLYRKRENLFGLGELTGRDRPSPQLVIVEGPLDAIAVDLTSEELSPLALCGTAICSQQVGHMASTMPKRISVALDGDQAGRRARENAYCQLRRITPSLHSIELPEGLDPSAVFSDNGAQALLDHLTRPRLLTDQLVDDRIASWPHLDESAEKQLCCLRETAALVVQMPMEDLTRQAGRLSTALDLDIGIVTRELISRVEDRYETKGTTVTCGSRNVPSSALEARGFGRA